MLTIKTTPNSQTLIEEVGKTQVNAREAFKRAFFLFNLKRERLNLPPLKDVILSDDVIETVLAASAAGWSKNDLCMIVIDATDWSRFLNLACEMTHLEMEQEKLDNSRAERKAKRQAKKVETV